MYLQLRHCFAASALSYKQSKQKPLRRSSQTLKKLQHQSNSSISGHHSVQTTGQGYSNSRSWVQPQFRNCLASSTQDTVDVFLEDPPNSISCAKSRSETTSQPLACPLSPMQDASEADSTHSVEQITNASRV